MENNDIKISIILSVYNVEKYLNQCMDSLINQTFKDFELICINDSSTDNSLNILNEYAEKDSRVKIITQPNGGLSSTRNSGMQNASGDYILFLDKKIFLFGSYYLIRINYVYLQHCNVVFYGK